MVTVNSVKEGINDRMWTAGCRITSHDLTADEVRSKIVDSAFSAFAHVEWAKLVELVTQDDQYEPGRAWKNKETNKWDNPHDTRGYK